MTKQNKVFLIWPEQLKSRKKLIKFYFDYISCFAPGTNLNIILKDNSIKENVIEQIASRNRSINISFHHIPEVMDIWIRDWAPLPVQTDKGMILLKAKYRPAYIKEKDSLYSEGDDMAGRRLAGILKMSLVDFPLVWDLGNFTHNSEGTGIVTARILKDNPQYNEKEIRALFLKFIGITQLLIIPEEPGDETGHVDGTLRFIDRNHLVLAQYPDDHIEENTFLNQIELKIREKIKGEVRITRILNGPILDIYCEGIGSAWGNHINYFSIGDYLYFPSYGIKEDLIAKDSFKMILKKNIIDVNTTEVNKLADIGGVLHCMTWGI